MALIVSMSWHLQRVSFAMSTPMRHLAIVVHWGSNAQCRLLSEREWPSAQLPNCLDSRILILLYKTPEARRALMHPTVPQQKLTH